MVMRRLFRESWSPHENGVRRSLVSAFYRSRGWITPVSEKKARFEAFRAVTGDEKEVVNMKQLEDTASSCAKRSSPASGRWRRWRGRRRVIGARSG